MAGQFIGAPIPTNFAPDLYCWSLARQALKVKFIWVEATPINNTTCDVHLGGREFE